MIAASASAHDWIEDGGYRNAWGALCCTENPGDREITADCGPIPAGVAWESGIGSIVELTLPHGVFTITINTIYPSADPGGRAMACATGCLFRPAGM